ncbi:MAG: hypothetical protein RL448_725, partial [Actinomycetota bacterium]
MKKVMTLVAAASLVAGAAIAV